MSETMMASRIASTRKAKARAIQRKTTSCNRAPLCLGSGILATLACGQGWQGIDYSRDRAGGALHDASVYIFRRRQRGGSTPVPQANDLCTDPAAPAVTSSAESVSGTWPNIRA